MSVDLTQLQFCLIAAVQKVNIDYTPNWEHHPGFINSCTFPRVLADKAYQYRVLVDGTDLGPHGSYEVQKDGSQFVNLVEHNGGYGISDSKKFQIFVVDPTTGNWYKVAQWN